MIVPVVSVVALTVTSVPFSTTIVVAAAAFPASVTVTVPAAPFEVTAFPAALISTFLPPSTSIVAPVAPETFTSVVVAASTSTVVALVTFKVFVPVQEVVSAFTAKAPLIVTVSTFLTSKPAIVVVFKAAAANIFSVSLPSPPSIESKAVKVVSLALNRSLFSVPTKVSTPVVKFPVPLI